MGAGQLDSEKKVFICQLNLNALLMSKNNPINMCTIEIINPLFHFKKITGYRNSISKLI